MGSVPTIDDALRDLLTKAISQTTLQTAQQTDQLCAGGITQALGIRLIGSNVNVTGDFLATQRATLAFQCWQNALQDSSASTAARAQYVDALTESITTALGSVDLPANRDAVRRVVERNVDLALQQECRANVVTGLQLDIIDSSITVGCSNDKVRRLAEFVEQGFRSLVKGTPLSAAHRQALAELNECARKSANLSIVQNFDASAGCKQLFAIADDLLADPAIQAALRAREQQPPSLNSAAAPVLPQWALVVLIAIGTLFVIMIIVLVFVAIRRGTQPKSYEQYV